MTKVLFFSPSANIWEHSFPEAMVAEMLAANGLTVTMVRCRGALRPFCPAGQAAGFTTDTPVRLQQDLCTRCNAKGRLIDRTMGLRSVEIDDFLEPGDDLLIENLIQQANTLRDQLRNAESFDLLRIQNHAVGRTALYELILRYKINDYEFSDSIWEEYLGLLKLAARVCLTSERLLEAEKPDRVSVYNSLYVAHRAFCLQARERGADQYFMHAGTNLSRQHGTLMIGRDFTWKYLLSLVDRYSVYQDKAVAPMVVDDVTEHFLCLMSSGNIFVYSAERSHNYFDVRAHFGVRSDQKLIVASTSSYDERFAVEATNAANPPAMLLFPRILDWVAYLIELATSRPDWFLLIRVHPREFPNRRDQVQSEHSRQMKLLLQDLPPNVRVNWPDENLSIYDLAQEADVFLNAWSSVGKEMALLGLPVVIYSPDLVLYPTALNFVGRTKEQYSVEIEKALASGWSYERCKMAYRWFALEFSRSCVDMRISFAPRRRYQRNFAEKVLFKIAQAMGCYLQERLDLMCRKTMPIARDIVYRIFEKGLDSSELAQEQGAFDGTLGEEDMAIRASLGRLGKYLFAANPLDQPSKLKKAFIAAGIEIK